MRERESEIMMKQHIKYSGTHHLGPDIWIIMA